MKEGVWMIRQLTKSVWSVATAQVVKIKNLKEGKPHAMEDIMLTPLEMAFYLGVGILCVGLILFFPKMDIDYHG